MKKKIFVTLFLMLILLANLSFASYSTVTMTVVEEPVCKIEFTENSDFDKKLISKDLNNKEVTIQLQVTNNELASKPTGEVVLVIDNSNSMKNLTNTGEIRSEIIKSSAKRLVNDLLADNTSLKVGVVSFSTSSEKNSEGFVTLGTENDSKLLTNLTSDVSTLTTAIDNITYVSEGESSYTNLQSGLNRAKKLFTTENNDKYIIVLTDGVPNVILNRNEVKYNQDTISATKSEYTSIISSEIDTITMLTGIEDGNASLENNYTYNEYIESIFGTNENPTVGDFYYITDDKIEETIISEIYNSLVPSNKSFKDITIVDYFPKEIVDNFDFAYITENNIGLISTTIDTTNNSITWTIPELAVGETATVQYNLRLKENFDSSIVDKILDTNEKVDISYTDFNNEAQEKTSDVTPKLKLTEPTVKAPDKTLDKTPDKAPNNPPKVLPAAGITSSIITFTIFAGSLLVFSIIKLISINKKFK